MTHYVKCKYEKGMWDNEKIVAINAVNRPEGKYSFFAFDSELLLAEKGEALIRIVSGSAIGNGKAMVMLREQGNPTYFTVPLEDIVEKEVKQ